MSEFVGGSEVSRPAATDEVGVMVGAEHGDRPVAEEVRRTACIERLECGLCIGFVRDDLAEDIVRESLSVAAEVDIYTNTNIITKELASRT